MKLKGSSLIEWLHRNNKSPRTGKKDLYSRFTTIADYLNQNVHPHVNVAADAHDGGTLTDHGPDHVATVISRASELIDTSTLDLDPYEVYMLLIAIHLHDVGNIFGRDSHEVNGQEVAKKVGSLMADDRVEILTIQKIAAAHGGHVDGDKDVIVRLAVSEPVNRVPIRMRQLAALLRIADELADDHARAAGFLLKLSKVDPSSEIYHKYADTLHSVMIKPEGGVIELHFVLTLDDACRKFGKGTAHVYLLDEIFNRTLKMHCERIYCMRFLKPQITFDRISIQIKVFGDGFNEELASIPYRLEEVGYPVCEPIHILCPSLGNLHYGSPLDGQALHAYLNGLNGGGSA